MIPGDLLSACPHRQFHTLPGLLDSRAALSDSHPKALRAKQGGSLYHFYKKGISYIKYILSKLSKISDTIPWNDIRSTTGTPHDHVEFWVTILPSDSAHYAHIDLSFISSELWEIPVFSPADGTIIFLML